MIMALGMYGCDGGVNSPNTINGIAVPPAPDPIEDEISIGGVDTNNNIVRDSVERMLAEEFGNDPVFYEQAKEYAIAEQIAIMDPTPEKVAAFIDLIRCVEEDHELDDLEKVTTSTIDTKERGYAYAEAFAGAVIADGGC